MKLIKGQTGGPFQLLISVIVFGMALVIGGYLFQNMECYKCTELLKIESQELSESIATIGKGAVNSRKSIMINIDGLGSCAEGIYLKKIEQTADVDCASFCPKHPNTCWAIITKSTCGDNDIDIDCIDISGDLNIVPESPDFLGVINSPDQWIDNSYGLTYTIPVTIKKTGSNELSIGRM
jgi:hypothetical protein